MPERPQQPDDDAARRRRDRRIMRGLAREQLMGWHADADPLFEELRSRRSDHRREKAPAVGWLRRVTGLGPRRTRPGGTVTWRLRRKRLLRPLTSRLAKLLIRLGLKKPRPKVYRPNPVMDRTPPEDERMVM